MGKSEVSEELINVINNIIKKQTDIILMKMEENFSSLKSSMDATTKKVDEHGLQIKQLERKVQMLEQIKKSKNLRILGLPESDSEDVEQEVLNLFNKKLKIFAIPESLQLCVRVGKLQVNASQDPQGGKRKNSPRPILVTFTAGKKKSEIFAAKKLLKSTGITILEDLAAHNQKLLKDAVEKFGRKKAWSLNGKIYVSIGNTKRIIESVEDLVTLSVL